LGCGCWQNELDLLGRIRHPNIVSLLGFCVHEGNHYIVYELMEKGSLDTQLHGTVSYDFSYCLWMQLFLEIFILGAFGVWLSSGPSHGSALSWHIRMKIALDMARFL
jgi:hypothetical protein